MEPRLPTPKDFLCDHSLLSLFLPGGTKRADGQEIYQLQGRVMRIFLFFFSLFSTMWATNIAIGTIFSAARNAHESGYYSTNLPSRYLSGSSQSRQRPPSPASSECTTPSSS